MDDMKRTIAAFALIAAFASTPVWAEMEIGEGYATPNYRELVQTAVMTGIYDIRTPAVADEYGRVIYCNLYRKEFSNDVSWDKIRQRITERVTQKKEYFRTLYETSGPVKLDRYDFNTSAFPISNLTSMRNIGSISLMTASDADRPCGQKNGKLFFPANIVLELNRPLMIDRIYVPQQDVEKLLARIEESKDKKRTVYARLRMRIGEGVGTKQSSGKLIMRGDIDAVDFFLDKEMTKPVGGYQTAK